MDDMIAMEVIMFQTVDTRKITNVIYDNNNLILTSTLE